MQTSPFAPIEIFWTRGCPYRIIPFFEKKELQEIDKAPRRDPRKEKTYFLKSRFCSLLSATNFVTTDKQAYLTFLPPETIIRLRESDLKILGTIYSRPEKPRSKYNKSKQFLLKKIPHCPVFSRDDKNSLKIKNIFFDTLDMEKLGYGLCPENFKAEIQEILKTKFDKSNPAIQSFISSCGRYIFKAARKQVQILLHYYTLTALRKICEQEYFDRLFIPHTILVDAPIVNKTYTVLVQNCLQESCDGIQRCISLMPGLLYDSALEYQNLLRNNKDYSLDRVIEQFIKINLKLPIYFGEASTTILHDKKQRRYIALLDFEVDSEAFIKEDRIDQSSALTLYDKRVEHNLKPFFNANTELIFKKNLMFMQ